MLNSFLMSRLSVWSHCCVFQGDAQSPVGGRGYYFGTGPWGTMRQQSQKSSTLESISIGFAVGKTCFSERSGRKSALQERKPRRIHLKHDFITPGA